VLDNVMTGLHLRGTVGLAAALVGGRRVAEEDRHLAAEAEEILAFIGLGHRRRETASLLPYGEQRLVELGIALAARPALLLLDEPAAGMAGRETESVSTLIRNIRTKGTTVLLVEHDMRLVMGISDTVIVLNHGAVIAEGPPAAIQSHPAVIRAYLGGGSAGVGPGGSRVAPA
jgi:branched-chain amino acid transport system ATP-binding protein